MCCT
jgi:hypothetical protein